jgi:hypothetical protein
MKVSSVKEEAVVLEDIESIRQEQGIDDVTLHHEISSLHRGDSVKLTLVTGPATSETIMVCITSIRGTAFRGKLTGIPAAKSRAKIKMGAIIAFRATHIHSVAAATVLKKQ